MKIEYLEGCSYSLTIDGVETCGLSVDEFKTKLKDVIDIIDDVSILQNVLGNIMENIGECECSEEPCEDCGAYNDAYILDTDNVHKS